MSTYGVIRFFVVMALAVAVFGLSGSPCAQEKAAAPPSGTEPAVQPPPAPKESALPLPPGASANTAVLTVPGTAFHPRESTTTIQFQVPGYIYIVDSGYVTTPIYLPQGAVITSIRMHYYDAHASSNCNAYLYIYPLDPRASIALATASSTGSSGNGYADSGTISHTVDYNVYSYALTWSSPAGSDLRLWAVSIYYKPPPGRAAVIPLF